MDRFSTLNVGRLDSVAGVGQNQAGKAPSLASFLAQRANQVLGAQQRATSAVETRAVEAQATPAPAEDLATIDPRLARQMEQMQRLSTSISPSAYSQSVSVVV